MIRLNKYLASIGIASRRKIDEFIANGKIKINKEIATLGQKVDPQKDKIELNIEAPRLLSRGISQSNSFNPSGAEKINDHSQINSPSILQRRNQILSLKKNVEEINKIYILLNKPKGYLTTTIDNQNRPTVLDLVHENTRLFPIGRLDFNSEGLIILTNDGELTQKLTHPKYHIEKTYQVDVFGIVTSEKIKMLQNGIELEDGQQTKPAKVKILKVENGKTTLEIVLSEGKKRQIRRMFSAVRFHILKLVRTKIGFLELGKLKTGKWRRLSKEEIGKLLNQK